MEDIENRIAGDQDFQATLENLSDEEKAPLIQEKRDAIIAEELAASKKNKELADSYKTRSEKAEADLKKFKPTVEPKQEESKFSIKDTIALSKIDENDIDEVVEYAAFKKIPIADALKSNVVQTLIKEKTEQRRTAAATQTRQTRQTKKVDGAEIVDNIKTKGEEGIPNAGSSEAEELFWARRGGRREK